MKKTKYVYAISYTLMLLVPPSFAQETADQSEGQGELKAIDMQGRPLEGSSGTAVGSGEAQAPSVTPEQMAQMMKTLQEAKLKQEEAQKALKEIEENE